VVLAIGGTDPCAAAGLAVDMRVLEAHDVHAMIAVAAVTVQNPVDGVSFVRETDAELLLQQVEAVRAWAEPQAIKIGLIPSAETMVAVIEALSGYSGPVVVDPVMRASGGGRLVALRPSDAVLKSLGEKIALWTPNVDEFVEVLSCEIDSLQDLEAAASLWRERFGAAVLAKGGHLIEDRGCDLLIDDTGLTRFPRCGPILSARGTGCALASAITAHLAHGESLQKAVERARDWLGDQRGLLATTESVG
jgi:hydroxymethylpyrimidine kinase/phosphomethylpyrimidine kinase